MPVTFNYGSHWYKRADMWAQGHSEENTGIVVMIAGLFIVAFVAVFYKRHRWEMYEQQYREILSKMPENERPG
ncbi:MAG: hypothetical protein JST39_00175, partial [Bacteroidetes bacterium]|nr:hypothetical protein [Bacteroidota bacterium]